MQTQFFWRLIDAKRSFSQNSGYNSCKLVFQKNIIVVRFLVLFDNPTVKGK